MNVTEKELKLSYRNKETDELLQLYRDGGLIDIATKALKEELQGRGLVIEDAVIKAELREKEDVLATSSKTIKNSMNALLVIALLQIIVSIGLKFYIGVPIGIFMAIAAVALKTKKSQGPALIIISIGVILFILNFFGPLVTKTVWGNSVLSLIVIWLGMRCKKAAKIFESRM